MYKLTCDEIVDKRTEFLLNFKDVMKRKKEFKPFVKMFKGLEADYDKILIPSGEKEKTYTYISGKHIVQTTLAKAIKKHYGLKEMPKDHVIAEFIAILNSIVWKEPPKIIVYSGADIPEVYTRMHRTSEAMQTCMTKPSCIRCTHFFADNPDKVELRCFEDVVGIKARALVWKLPNDKIVVDRIYPNTGENFEKFKALYAGKKNVYIRSDHGGGSTILSPNKTFVIEMKKMENNNYPYMDTFKYGYFIDDKIFITNTRTMQTNLTLTNSSGGLVN